MPPDGKPVFEQTRGDIFSMGRLSFKEGNKWSLSEGDNTISVSSRDQEFVSKVDANKVAFAEGDLLTCDLRTTKHMVGGELKTNMKSFAWSSTQSVTHFPLALTEEMNDHDSSGGARPSV